MKLPPPNALRAFEAAARLKSFSAAGDELHVTHAAISHHIKQLEQWFGRALFHRGGRGVELTQTGRELGPVLSQSFSGIAELCGRLRLAQGAGTISVGCIPSIASRWLIPNLQAFSSTHPQIDVQVLYADANTRLPGSACDVLITLGESGLDTTVGRKLFSRASKPVCSPHYLAKAQGPILSAADIAQAHLLHDENRSAWAEWFGKAEVKTGQLGGPVFQDFNLLATAAIAGHGIALCPVDVFRRELEQGDLVVVSEVCTKDDEGYYLITETQPPAAVRQFSEWFAGVVDAPRI